MDVISVVISAAVISVVLTVAFRWGSDKPNKRVSLDVAIDRHHKEQQNKRKINSQSSNNATGWLDNRAEGSRRRGNQSAISEV